MWGTELIGESECTEAANTLFLLETPNPVNLYLTWIRNTGSIALMLGYPQCSLGETW